MTSGGEDKSVSLTGQTIKAGGGKRRVKNIVKLNLLPLPETYFQYSHSFTQIDHSKFNNNTRKEEFQNCKTIICWKKKRGGKQNNRKKATNIFNVTTNVTVLVSNI